MIHEHIFKIYNKHCQLNAAICTTERMETTSWQSEIYPSNTELINIQKQM